MDRECTYKYSWRNNIRRQKLHGRECRVIARGAFNSRLVKFLDDGHHEVVSGNALRRVRKGEEER